MIYLRVVGASAVAASCAGVGFQIAWEFLTRERMLKDLLEALERMEARLEYDRCPLPELIKEAGELGYGKVFRVLKTFSGNLEKQLAQDVSGCMKLALEENPVADSVVRHNLIMLGASLGKFDYEGQKKSLQRLKASAENGLHRLEQDSAERIRCYRTLGICAGIGLAVLLV